MTQKYSDLLKLMQTFGIEPPEDHTEIDPNISRETVACSPDENVVGTGFHKHHCHPCNYTWKHANGLPRVCSFEESRAAHTCPLCGNEEWDYFGDH